MDIAREAPVGWTSGQGTRWVLVAFAEGRKGGMAGMALVEGGWESLSNSSPKRSSVGEEGLLAFAGGLPVGVEGGALFLPFLGVVDIEYNEFNRFSRRVPK
jgi:hypothetical protein